MKAARHGIALDVSEAAAGFQSNPFLWEAGGNRMSQASVTFLWSWVDDVGTHTYNLEHPAADKVFKRGVPVPNTLRADDMDVHRRLLAVAETETNFSKAPCRYLGHQTGPNRYEENPQNWPAGTMEERTTHTTVVYE